MCIPGSSVLVPGQSAAAVTWMTSEPVSSNNQMLMNFNLGTYAQIKTMPVTGTSFIKPFLCEFGSFFEFMYLFFAVFL
jgi:hypothetical protein